MGQPVYRSRPQVVETASRALVISCSAYDFQPYLRDFLAAHLHLAEGAYDLLAVPGGGQFLLLTEYLPKFAWVGQKWVRFQVERHQLPRVVVIGHEGCGWYNEERVVPTFLHGLIGTAASQQDRQRADLARIAAALRGMLPMIAVETYYAEKSADGTIQFTREA